jgi:hypothetical protein
MYSSRCPFITTPSASTPTAASTRTVTASASQWRPISMIRSAVGKKIFSIAAIRSIQPAGRPNCSVRARPKA